MGFVGGFGRGIGQGSQGMTSAPGGGTNAAASQSQANVQPSSGMSGLSGLASIFGRPSTSSPSQTSFGSDVMNFGGGGGGGGFDPVAGSGNRFFSRAASPARPFQPFDVNKETPAQYQAASYEPNTIANQVASGYRQVFGRDADAGGMGYYANALGNQPRTQAEVNRYLLGGATGADVGAGADYALSLTGGRPELYDTSKVIGTDSAGKPQYEYRRQFKQPVYQPTYSNYSMNRGFYSPGYSMGRSLGMNPFSYNYAVGGNVYADDNNEEDQGIAGLLGK